MDLDGRVALVTAGGRRGIGRTAAIGLAAAGATVVLVATGARCLESAVLVNADGLFATTARSAQEGADTVLWLVQRDAGDTGPLREDRTPVPW